MSNEDCNASAVKISEFLRKREWMGYETTLQTEESQKWEKTIGVIARQEIFGPQKIDWQGGHWWLASFIRIVDSLQCRIIIVDKRKKTDFVTPDAPDLPEPSL